MPTGLLWWVNSLDFKIKVKYSREENREKSPLTLIGSYHMTAAIGNMDAKKASCERKRLVLGKNHRCSRPLLPLCGTLMLLFCLRFPKHPCLFWCLTQKREPFTPHRFRVGSKQLSETLQKSCRLSSFQESSSPPFGGNENHVESFLKMQMMAPPQTGHIRSQGNYVSVCSSSSAVIPISVHT